MAAGEYAAELDDVDRLCPVVDCLQLDVTRCGGYTGWLRGAAVAQAHNLQISAHCAPALHASAAAAVPNLRHLEWFIDHARLEPLLVDGAPTVHHGALHPGGAVPGHGMTISEQATQYRVSAPENHDFGTRPNHRSEDHHELLRLHRRRPHHARGGHLHQLRSRPLRRPHVRLETRDHTQAATPGNPSHHRTRSLICTGCDSVLRTVAA